MSFRDKRQVFWSDDLNVIEYIRLVAKLSFLIINNIFRILIISNLYENLLTKS